MTRHHFDWEGSLNTRDLGGLPVHGGRLTREGFLIRGDTTCGLTDRGRESLLADGIRTIVDLRNYSEIEAEPDPFASARGVRYLHLPLNDALVEERIREIASPPERYVVMVDADGERVAAIFDALAAAPRAVLFHCAGGRDRTGLVAALLLALVGVNESALEDDFILSDERLAPRSEIWRATHDSAQVERFDRSVREARASIRAAMSRIRERWGDVDGYLLAHGAGARTAAEIRSGLIA